MKCLCGSRINVRWADVLKSQFTFRWKKMRIYSVMRKLFLLDENI